MNYKHLRLGSTCSSWLVDGGWLFRDDMLSGLPLPNADVLFDEMYVAIGEGDGGRGPTQLKTNSNELRNNLSANTYAVHLLQKLEAVTSTTIDEKLFEKIKAQLGKFNETSQKALQIVDIMHSYIEIEKPIQKTLNLPAILTSVRDQIMFIGLQLQISHQ